jgi:bifunctional non-homologous end joining protein LigD
MSLDKYNKLRRFDETAEPPGHPKKSKSKQLEFVVQKHRASHLHYDFRLEMEGVLKSWAVPKGPSLNPEDKRLAMMTEDHPYDYRSFEGIIPKGNYGAGEVIVWDNGTYEPGYETPDPEKELLKRLKKGHLDIILHGKKLKGRFDLVKLRGGNAEENAWLLVKKKDNYTDSEDVTEKVESVVSGRVLQSDQAEAMHVEDTPSSPMPKNFKPMLATLVDEPFDDTDWLYEIKWDGYRAIASWDGKTAQLYSRNGKDFSKKYVSIFEAVHNLKQKVVFDGEIVVIDKDGVSHFEWLQGYANGSKGELAYYIFDMPWYEGHDLKDWPLKDRKELLAAVLKRADDSRLQFSDHIAGKGKSFFKTAQVQKLEGIMAKQKQSRYIEGTRSRQWLKIKTHLRQETVIGGFTEPRGSRKHLGSLLVGIYDEKGVFKFAGHVGGVPPKILQELRQQLEKLERKTSPFAEANKVKPNAPVHWVKPEQLVEVTFSEWTSDGRMRHPIFVGLRADKPPEKVTKESAMHTEIAKKESGGTRVKFTHPDKIFWPESGITKGDLLRYYMDVSELILPDIKDRPQSMLRQPDGYKGKAFFQKDAAGILPDWAKTASVYSESNKKEIHYFVTNTAEDLQLLVQLGCIEINPWSSRTANLHKPDWVVLDLDPEGVEFKEVVKVAKVARQICDELGLPCYPKTSGKTGIHIFVPAGAKYTYDQLKQFGEILANLVHERTKDITSVLRNPSKRQHKIYLDFLQNREGQTLAAPYSVRPTKAASVSTPLHWDEVKAGLMPEKFTMKNAPKRFKRVGDIWQPVLGKGIDLKAVLNKLS